MLRNTVLAKRWDEIGEERLLGCDSFAEMKTVKILKLSLCASH